MFLKNYCKTILGYKTILGFNTLILYLLVLAECNDERLLVSLDDGVIRGHYKTSFGGRTYMAFEGLPYAKPPVQKLRYRVRI